MTVEIEPRRHRHRREPPIPGPTFENWIALAMMLLTTMFVAIALFPAAGLLFLFAIVYAIAMTVGVFRVRPAEGKERSYLVFFIPVLLQVGVYLLFWSRAAYDAILGHDFPGPDFRMMETLGLLCVIAFFSGWVPSLLLLILGRGGVVLLVAQAAIPGLIGIWLMGVLSTHWI